MIEIRAQEHRHQTAIVEQGGLGEIAFLDRVCGFAEGRIAGNRIIVGGTGGIVGGAKLHAEFLGQLFQRGAACQKIVDGFDLFGNRLGGCGRLQGFQQLGLGLAGLPHRAPELRRGHGLFDRGQALDLAALDRAGCEFALCQQRSMRQVHIAGEKLFVDYAGTKPSIIDVATGEVIEVELFVDPSAVLVPSSAVQVGQEGPFVFADARTVGAWQGLRMTSRWKTWCLGDINNLPIQWPRFNRYHGSETDAEAARQSLLSSQGSLGIFFSNGLVSSIMALGFIALSALLMATGRYL